MISCPTVSKPDIRFHYDLTTVFYRLLWGRHIHHGLWDATFAVPPLVVPSFVVPPSGGRTSEISPDRSPPAPISATIAAQRLTETLAREAAIANGATVLDI